MQNNIWLFIIHTLCSQSNSHLYLAALLASLQPPGIQCLAQGHVSMVDTFQNSDSSAVLYFCKRQVTAYPLGQSATPQCFDTLANLKSVKQDQISFHTLALLTFRWQLLSWHMCIVLLSIILAATAALTLHGHRGHSVGLCGSLWLAKRYRVEGPKQKQFFSSWGEYIEVKWTSFFSHIHFTWSLVSNTFIMSEQRPHNSLWHSPEYQFPELSWYIHAIVMLPDSGREVSVGSYVKIKAPLFFFFILFCIKTR